MRANGALKRRSTKHKDYGKFAIALFYSYKFAVFYASFNLVMVGVHDIILHKL